MTERKRKIERDRENEREKEKVRKRQRAREREDATEREERQRTTERKKERDRERDRCICALNPYLRWMEISICLHLTLSKYTKTGNDAFRQQRMVAT